MTRGEFLKSLSDQELALYLYLNSKYTRLGKKRITEWVTEEITEDEIKKVRD